MSKNSNLLLEDVSCCLGCPKNDELLFSAQDLLHSLPGEYKVVKCCTCGLIRTNPRPTPETIGLYYPDNYGPYIGSIVNLNAQKQNVGFKSSIKPLVNRIFNFNGTTLPELNPGRMLEIGCASGSYLHYMASKGWVVEGVVFSEKAAKAAQQLGYKVHVGALENAPQPEESYDLVVGWMVLEHLHDPVGSLKKLRDWTKPEAWLALSVPNAGSLDFTLFKDEGFALQLPTHLHHFTTETLAKVLSAGGWQIVKVYHQRTLSNFVGSVGYKLRANGYEKLAKKFIDFPEKGGFFVYFLYPLSVLMSLFGQTGRMTVWAKKT
jgi:2-polyprenyl-3-methyl-5-hydroxy-6-metoxy-1,4-benzoquinol methylase